MKIIFVTKEKRKFYEETIEDLVRIALYNNEFEIAENGAILMSDICGLHGLNYAKAKCDERLKQSLAESEEE